MFLTLYIFIPDHVALEGQFWGGREEGREDNFGDWGPVG